MTRLRLRLKIVCSLDWGARPKLRLKLRLDCFVGRGGEGLVLEVVWEKRELCVDDRLEVEVEIEIVEKEAEDREVGPPSGSGSKTSASSESRKRSCMSTTTLSSVSALSVQRDE